METVSEIVLVFCEVLSDTKSCWHNCVVERKLHCVSKNDTDVAHYNFHIDQPFLIISCRDVAE